MQKFYEEYIPGNLSVYEYLLKESNGYADYTAIRFYGKTFSYKTLFDRIDAIAQALVAYGVKKGDVVASSLPGCPEGVFLIYAINKIGAIYCAFDCRSKRKEIEETLETFSPKLCFVPTFQINEIRDVYHHTIVYVSVVNSLGGLVRFGSAFADFFKGRCRLYLSHDNFISYERFVKRGVGERLPSVEKNNENIFGYFYTSGTTYGRKSIILTNENINAAIIQQRESNDLIQSGDSILNIMPLFTCYSVTLAVHLPLICGVSVNIIPLLKTKRLKKTIEKEKPNFIISVPAHWEWFISENFEGCDLSFIKAIIIGGDVMESTFRSRVNEILKKCGCTNPLVIGYGLSETASTATSHLLPSSPGSVGRPFKNTLIQIFDKEKQQPLAPYEKGEICIHGPTVCKGYFNDTAMTDALLQKHSDGKIWLHSGDSGYIDNTGSLFFCERIKRMYVRFDGSKISPFSIEQIISACSEVERCMVVSIRDLNHSHGMCAKALIVLKKNKASKTAQIAVEKYIRKNLDAHMLPAEIVFVDKLPYTINGKRDYFASY